MTLTADTLFFENPGQCLDGQIVTINNSTDIDLDLLYVQQESDGSSSFPWSVEPWPFTSFPHTMTPGESIDLNVVLPLPVKGETDYYYDELIVVSEIDTQTVVIAVNQGLYTSIEDPGRIQGTLSMNSPNPFAKTTMIKYSLTQMSNVVMEVFNINGKKVKILVNESLPSGNYHVQWDGTNDAGQKLPGGIYIYRLQANDATFTRRCVLLR